MNTNAIALNPQHEPPKPTALASVSGSMAYKSCALWPKGCADAIGNYSEDTHETREAAEAVRDMLKRDGFGGDRQNFPIKAWIEMVEPQNDPN